MKKLFLGLVPPMMLLGACGAFTALGPVTWSIAVIMALVMILCLLIILRKAPSKFYQNTIFQTWLSCLLLGHCLEFLPQWDAEFAQGVFWLAISCYMLWVFCVRREEQAVK